MRESWFLSAGSTPSHKVQGWGDNSLHTSYVARSGRAATLLFRLFGFVGVLTITRVL